MINPGKVPSRPASTVGVVPLGTPMIVGPAVLTTLLILVQSHGYPITLLAFGVNMILAYVGLRYARVVGHILGEAGSRAIGKVASVFLAAFGVSLVRRGLPGFVSQ